MITFNVDVEMIEIIKPASHEDWLAVRAKGLGSSEVGTVLGVNGYDTPYKLWLRKTGQAPAVPTSVVMQIGHELEDYVARLFSEATGVAVDESTAGDWCVRNDSRPYMIASPDRLCDAPAGRVLLECKTTRAAFSEDDYPRVWYCQVQYLLTCLEMDTAVLAWLNVTNGAFGYKWIKRDDKFAAFMIERLDAFWDCVKTGRAPAPLTAEDVYAQHPAVAGLEKEADAGVLAALKELKAKKAEVDAAEEEIAAYEEQIKLFMRDAEVLTSEGATVATWRVSKPAARLDTAALKAAHPDLVKEFTKKGEPTRRFLLK